MNCDYKKIIQEILICHERIDEVLFLACGGSLVDLYPAAYFAAHEGINLRASAMPAIELIADPPKRPAKHILAIICSHGGSTPEALEAATYAKNAGMAVVTFSNKAGSPITKLGDYTIIYGWDAYPIEERCPVQALLLMNELLHQTQEHALYKGIACAARSFDGLVRGAMEAERDKADAFAKAHAQERMFYVLGSGAAFYNAYGFSICSIMEMQWMDSAYLHSAEFFHGPFEVADGKPYFLLLKTCGHTRFMDERVEAFLSRQGCRYDVLDAAQYLEKEMPSDVAEYYAPNLFYYLSCVYREALAKERGHDLDERRYMGKTTY